MFDKLTRADTRINRADYNALAEQARCSQNQLIVGGDSTDAGGQLVALDIPREEGCWARIIDYVKDQYGNPVTDANGVYSYQWIEQTLDTAGGAIVFRDKDGNQEDTRGSYTDGTTFFNTARTEQQHRSRRYTGVDVPGLLADDERQAGLHPRFWDMADCNICMGVFSGWDRNPGQRRCGHSDIFWDRANRQWDYHLDHYSAGHDRIAWMVLCNGKRK